MKQSLLRCAALVAAAAATQLPAAEPQTAAAGQQTTPSQETAPLKKRQGGGPENPERPFRPPPPAILSPEEALKTFKLPPGFKIQLVAAEPLVETPVAIAWDSKGRMYVVEMRNYMPDMDATGEDQPLGRIKRLEDTDGDGTYDKATVFVDKLVMPRAVIATGDGILALTPPNLTFYRDTKGDGVADYSELVDGNVGKEGGQPEYLPNSPLYALDNWITFSHHTLKYRYQQGVFTSMQAGKSGQWGRSQDDWGRQFFNYNSDLLRADLVPPLWYARNPHLSEKAAINVQLIKDQTVWPGHPNPGINRGYGPKSLRENGTQAATTATCGPGIYRGNLFPAEYSGNAFVPEPAGNLVKRLILSEKAGLLSAENAYPDKEFLTSTDERFRPVNAMTGPDGGLYIVDMARGVIQHKVFLSYYLAANIEERKLETPLNLGRIYRIVPDSAKPRFQPLPEEPQALVRLLSHKNGWVRDNAQRLLVEQGDPSIVPLLEKIFRSGPTPQSRVHSLWCMEGLHALTPEIIRAALKDRDVHVRSAGLKLLTEATWQFALLPQKSDTAPSDPATATAQAGPAAGFTREIDALVTDRNPEIQTLVAFQIAANNTPGAREMLTTLLRKSGSIMVAQGAAAGFVGNELVYLKELLTLPPADSQWLVSSQIIKTLAACVMVERNAAKISDLLSTIETLPVQSPLLSACLSGMAGKATDKDKKPKPGSGPRPVSLASEPSIFAMLKGTKSPSIAELVARVDRQLTWPEKPLPEGFPPPPPPLSAADKLHFAKGKELYNTICAACHQTTGTGLPGLAPPLAGSEWVTGPADRAIKIILQGLTGPVEVAGTSWQLEMPAVTIFNDEQVADILTYIRRDWDNDGGVVTEAQVQAVRTQISDRKIPWTATELLQAKK